MAESDGEEAMIAEIFDGGGKVKMLDGSEWKLAPGSADITVGWLPGDSVTVRPASGSGTAYEIVNGDDTVGADDQIVRACIAIQIAPEEFSGRRIEPRQIVAPLAHEPHFVRAHRIGIARPAGLIWDRPFLDVDGVDRVSRPGRQAGGEAKAGGNDHAHGALLHGSGVADAAGDRCEMEICA